MQTSTRIVGSFVASLAVACTSATLAQGAPDAAPKAPPAPAAQAPAASGPVYVLFETSKGNILLALDPAKAPVTVANFVKYVKGGFYDNTTFHRIVPNFVVQGGGFDDKFVQKKTEAPIKNEWQNGLKNVKGSISMARTPSPDSATSQFFLNLKDNPALDGANGPGYAVFGRIVDGLEVMDAIAQSPTGRREVTVTDGARVEFGDVPKIDVVITEAYEISKAEIGRAHV